MNMQMALEEQQQTQFVQTTQDAAKPRMSCHETMNQTQGDQTHGGQTHRCLACGICALANASASFSTVPSFNLTINHPSTPPLVNVVFSSQDYPPAYKPPILN